MQALRVHSVDAQAPDTGSGSLPECSAAREPVSDAHNHPMAVCSSRASHNPLRPSLLLGLLLQVSVPSQACVCPPYCPSPLSLPAQVDADQATLQDVPGLQGWHKRRQGALPLPAPLGRIHSFGSVSRLRHRVQVTPIYGRGRDPIDPRKARAPCEAREEGQPDVPQRPPGHRAPAVNVGVIRCLSRREKSLCPACMPACLPACLPAMLLRLHHLHELWRHGHVQAEADQGVVKA